MAYTGETAVSDLTGAEYMVKFQISSYAGVAYFQNM
jgi:hypothetical protein